MGDSELQISSSLPTFRSRAGLCLVASSNIFIFMQILFASFLLISAVFASPVNLTSLYSPPRNFTPVSHVVTRDAGASQPAREKSANAILGYMYTDYEVSTSQSIFLMPRRIDFGIIIGREHGSSTCMDSPPFP